MRINHMNSTSFGLNTVQKSYSGKVLSSKVSSDKALPNFDSNYSVINLNSLYQTNNITFTRKAAEHKSWGGVIDPKTKEVSFKIFTFPDAKSVSVKVFDRDDIKKFQTYPLENAGGGVFQTAENLSSNVVKAGDRYSFVIKKADGTTVEVKDPYAMRQGNQKSEDFLNYSILYDHSKYEWKNAEAWKINDKRIVRNPVEGQKSIKEASIYELHIDTLTKEGTYDAAKDKLKEIKEAGFNTIELMPNENTFDFNWG